MRRGYGTDDLGPAKAAFFVSSTGTADTQEGLAGTRKSMRNLVLDGSSRSAENTDGGRTCKDTDNRSELARQPMNETEATLFVVDDEPSACKGVAALATSLGIPCKTFSCAEDFLSRYKRGRAGCLLIDLRLPGMSGLELQGRLVDMGSRLPVILISAYADVPATVRAMQNGALTVLTKPYRDDELADAVREALQRDRESREKLARQADVRRRIDSLTERERRLMEAVLAGRPNRLIARDLEISQRTVDRVRAMVFDKMGVESAVEVARLVAQLRVSDQA